MSRFTFTQRFILGLLPVLLGLSSDISLAGASASAASTLPAATSTQRQLIDLHQSTGGGWWSPPATAIPAAAPAPMPLVPPATPEALSVGFPERA
jgi:hypothetical protein